MFSVDCDDGVGVFVCLGEGRLMVGSGWYRMVVGLQGSRGFPLEQKWKRTTADQNL